MTDLFDDSPPLIWFILYRRRYLCFSNTFQISRLFNQTIILYMCVCIVLATVYVSVDFYWKSYIYTYCKRGFLEGVVGLQTQATRVLLRIYFTQVMHSKTILFQLEPFKTLTINLYHPGSIVFYAHHTRTHTHLCLCETV